MQNNTLIAKLAEIQKKLNVPKSQRNSFGNYNYRSCEDIVEAVKPLLGDCALVVTDEMVLIGERYYIKATARIMEGDSFIETNGYAREAETKKGMDESQITGASSSYARKYALNGLFAIDDTKDADSDEKPTTNRTASQTASQKPEQSNIEDTSSLGKCGICYATGKFHRKDCPKRETN